MSHLVLIDPLLHAERLFARREAATNDSIRLTYGELGARCRRLMGVLRHRGVSRGDRVAVLMHNSHRYLEIYFAVPGVGAVIVPLNTRHTVEEHRAVLDDCDARMVIADDVFQDVINEMYASGRDILSCPHAYEDLLADAESKEPDDRVHENDLAAIFYTGGTTGAPKGVMLTHRNLVANAFHITIAFGYRPDDVFLHVAPMFHLADAGSIHALTWQGARHVFLPKFEPTAVIGCIEQEQVTCLTGVPTMIQHLVEHPAIAKANLSSLRLIAHGGAPISAILLKRAASVLPCSFTQAYGLTEASSFAAVLPTEENLLKDARLHSVGRAAMGVELAVRRVDGSMCEPGEIGEITGRGPNFTSSYWRKPEQTAETLRSGWFWTGDLGHMDEDGYLYILDRAKDMIISGGENVYSTEVEAVVETHPSVLEAAVIGLPDEQWGERVHAVVVAKSGRELVAEDLRSFCKERIAGYKCPRSIELVETLPKSGAGKVLKRSLRARYDMPA